ncbi:Putative mycofactocin biosynthesis glycosyltransferase MftF [Halioglobus japonicus]|nr:Putative mycofactocin biosynthesis glycosyltransferase MftF [Halioglobus japonicus]
MGLPETPLAKSAQTVANMQTEHPISEPIHSSLAVCICTFMRPDGLRRLLNGLELQIFSVTPQPGVQIIVVDNSPDGSARAACESHQSRWSLRYLHEPRPGISYARNTALAAVLPGTDFIAMIDDDEVPAPDWLDQLLHAQARSDADVVVGLAKPIFPPQTPEWVATSGLFVKPENWQSLEELDPDPPAATCNVLVRAELLGPTGVTFDPALALSGGEDKLLFQSLKLSGYRFAWAAAARVDEWVPAERANLAYMWRESYRRGSVKYFVKRRLKARSVLSAVRIAVRLVIRSMGLIVWHALRMLFSLGQKSGAWVPYALNVADNLGTIAGVLHIPNRHYRPKDAVC